MMARGSAVLGGGGHPVTITLIIDSELVPGGGMVGGRALLIPLRPSLLCFNKGLQIPCILPRH